MGQKSLQKKSYQIWKILVEVLTFREQSSLIVSVKGVLHYFWKVKEYSGYSTPLLTFTPLTPWSD